MALFNKNSLKTVTLIEREENNEYIPIATAFVVGFLYKNDLDPTKKIYKLFLLTNRHVFSNFDSLWVRFDKKDSKETKRFPILLKDKHGIKWLAHKDQKVDLAMLAINPNLLQENNVDWLFINEEEIAYPEDFEKIGIELGDEVYLSGFPMGLSGINKNYAIVRSGIIARLDEEIIMSEKYILIDATVFPGNSGGPVFLKPQQLALNGTNAVAQAYLIGVISGYKPYKEQLYSHQTNPPSIAAISIENSGLASVVPMNFAKDIYKELLKDEDKLEKEVKGDKNATGDKVNTSI